MKKLLSATMLATSLIVAGGAFTVPAFAEVVYNRGNAADPESLDPHKTSTVYEAQYPARPVRRSGHAGRRMPNLIPGAAESWTVSDDGTVYTFKLRQDAVWSDGSPVTADDFVYSFRRARRSGDRRRIRLDALPGEERRRSQHRQGASRRTWASRRSTPTRSR